MEDGERGRTAGGRGVQPKRNLQDSFLNAKKIMNQKQEQELVQEPNDVNKQEPNKDKLQNLEQRLKMEEKHKEKHKKEPEQKHSADVLVLELLEIEKETNDLLELETDEERETLDLMEEETLDLVEQETMDLLELPEFIVRTVFLHLDGSSLHRCRQVCSVQCEVINVQCAVWCAACSVNSEL